MRPLRRVTVAYTPGAVSRCSSTCGVLTSGSSPIHVNDGRCPRGAGSARPAAPARDDRCAPTRRAGRSRARCPPSAPDRPCRGRRSTVAVATRVALAAPASSRIGVIASGISCSELLADVLGLERAPERDARLVAAEQPVLGAQQVADVALRVADEDRVIGRERRLAAQIIGEQHGHLAGHRADRRSRRCAAPRSSCASSRRPGASRRRRSRSLKIGPRIAAA